MASNVDLNTDLNKESDDKPKEHLITIEYNEKCKKIPTMEEKESFYTLFSPKTFNLEPQDHCILNLHFNITSKSKEIDPWISIIPTLKCRGIKILSKTVNRNGEIELMLQNESNHYTIEVLRGQILAFVFNLGLGPNDCIKTEFCNY